MPFRVLAAMAVGMASLAAEDAAKPWLDLPTGNTALFDGDPSDFYMYVDRSFEGRATKPWEGGTYGLVRGPRRGESGVFYTAFHEGIDIRPVHRNPAGEPLDPVVAAAKGTVVHVSDVPSLSNYGRYVVVEHQLDGSPYYTLYAHLGPVAVEVGQAVNQGEKLGVLGYTGAGLNRERAHLHFEFCFKLNNRFDDWHNQYVLNSPNHHGAFNGRNLNGINPAALLKAVRENSQLTVPEFVRQNQKPMFELTLNESPNFDLIRFYPWLVEQGDIAAPAAWTVTFSEELIPMKARAHGERVAQPSVRWVGSRTVAPVHLSRGLVAGTAAAPRLTDSGLRFAHLLTYPDQ